MSYDEAYKFLRSKRAIVSPNLGFMVQLMMFYQRLYEPDASGALKTKVFAISSHQVEDPKTIVARLLYDEFLYIGKKKIVLDPRGVFIIGNKDRGYVWIGEECTGPYREAYLGKVKQYLPYLQKYEHFPQNVQTVKQGEEDDQFWRTFQLEGPPEVKYKKNPAWNKW